MIDPIEIGDYTRRRRIYIILIHAKVIRNDVNSNGALELVLHKTLEKLKVIGKPSDPHQGFNF